MSAMKTRFKLCSYFRWIIYICNNMQTKWLVPLHNPRYVLWYVLIPNPKAAPIVLLIELCCHICQTNYRLIAYYLLKYIVNYKLPLKLQASVTYIVLSLAAMSARNKVSPANLYDSQPITALASAHSS